MRNQILFIFLSAAAAACSGGTSAPEEHTGAQSAALVPECVSYVGGNCLYRPIIMNIAPEPHSITLGWYGSWVGPRAFTIYRNGWPIQSMDGINERFTDTGLQSATAYDYQVCSAYSEAPNQVACTTIHTATSVPVGFGAPPTSFWGYPNDVNGPVHLFWSQGTTYAYQTIQQSGGDACGAITEPGGLRIAGDASTFTSAACIQPGTTYTYKLCGFTAHGISACVSTLILTPAH